MGHSVMQGKEPLEKYESEQVAFVLCRLWNKDGVTSWGALVTDITETIKGKRPPANPMSPFLPRKIYPPQIVLVNGIRHLVDRKFIAVEGLEPGVIGYVGGASKITRLPKLQAAGY